MAIVRVFMASHSPGRVADTRSVAEREEAGLQLAGSRAVRVDAAT
jgi:hypothetical protein